MNKQNLLKLANYLDSLPETYTSKHFDMNDFAVVEGATSLNIDKVKVSKNGPGYECGAVACAIGHGPAAGIVVEKDNSWISYSQRVFDLNDDALDWCFGGPWCLTDNTAAGAAARIRYLTTNGHPPHDWYFTMPDYERVIEPFL